MSSRTLILSLFVSATIAAACSHGGGSGAAPTPTDSPTPTPTAGSVNVESGIPTPSTVYSDLGVAPATDGVRAVLSFPVRNRASLETKVNAMYAPGSATFRQYLTRSAFEATYAPLQSDVDAVSAWLATQNLAVTRVAANRMMLETTGTVAAFNAAFLTTLHQFSRSDSSSTVYGTLDPLFAPPDVAAKLDAVVIADLPADTTPLPTDVGTVQNVPPGAGNFDVATIAKAYGLDTIYTAGHKGAGVTLGVIVGAAFKVSDVQTFWTSFGLTRTDPTIVTVAELPSTRYLETTLDVEWSGALAPDAAMIVYEGPDSRDTSLVWTFNEAIGRAEADVLTDSFAHREDAEAPAMQRAYDQAALEAAALGMTVISASGDSGKPDLPSSSPWVTAAGGTVLSVNGSGAISSEPAWSDSGSGNAKLFPRPDWQSTVAPNDTTRAVCDVSLNAGAGYWTRYLGNWGGYQGTSFASPVFAGIMASVDSARIANSKPPAGWLNSQLYGVTAVHASFHDVTSGTTGTHAAGPGWDYPSGWGSPDASALSTALP
ncbi:MAG TPA: S53 family serine peptidase [bacterium]|nr:S53 family serine peptidase [bacterium]